MLFRYFEDDDEEVKNLNDLEYQPAPGSPTLERMASGRQKDSDDSDSDGSDDPLEAFMADIEVRIFHQCNFYIIFYRVEYWHLPLLTRIEG